MSAETKTPKKINFLKLSDSRKKRFLNKVKENLREKVMEERFWMSLAETKRVTINGELLNFEGVNFASRPSEGLTGATQ